MRAVAPELIRLPEGPAPIREVFLVLPGLNFNPDRLEPWEAQLAVQGAATVRPALHGFTAADDPDWRTVTAESWLEDVSNAYLRAAERFRGARISLFGYSLGGVLGLVWSRRFQVPLHRAVLLAPALAARPLPRFGLSLCKLLPGRMMLRSWAPKAYRLHDETSMAAYKALRVLMGLFKEGAGEDPRALFAAVSGRDELVSPQAVEQYQARVAAARPKEAVRMHWIEHQPKPGWLYHLGVDADTLGQTPWQQLLCELEDWLAATAV